MITYSTEESDEYLADFSERDKKWDSHKRYSDLVAGLYQNSSYHRYFERISDCSKNLSFAETEEGKLKLHTAFFCRVPLCQICQWRRSLKLRAKFFNVLPKLLSDCEGFRYVFLTLTVRNCDVSDLRSTLSWMSDSWHKLDRRRIFPAYKTGYIRSAEITRNYDVSYGHEHIGRFASKQFYKLKSDLREKGFDLSKLSIAPTREAHPHFHALLMVDADYFENPKKYWKHSKWISEWRSALKCDYDPSVRITAIDPYAQLQNNVAYNSNQPEYAEYLTEDSTKSTAYTSNQVEYAINPEFIGVLLEVLKYSIKPSDLIGSICTKDAQDGFTNKDWLLLATEQLHKVRKFAPGGIFKSYLSEKDADADDLLTFEESEENSDIITDNEICFSWNKTVQKYTLLR